MKRWHSKHNPQIALTPDEMLEISQEISQGYAPNREGEAQELVLLPVDPYHMYAYWNLEEEKGRPSDLTLRVYWRPEEDRSTKESKLWFDVALQGYRNQCQVQLPIDETAYFAELGRYDPEQEFSVVADSNVIHVPRGRMAPEKAFKEPSQESDESRIASTAQDAPDDHSGSVEQEYDEARIDSHIRRDLHLQQDSHDLKTSGEQQGMVGTEREESAEVRIDAEIRQTLQDKGFSGHLESLSGAGEQAADTGEVYNESEIDAQIKRTLHEKGYGSDIAQLSATREGASEQNHRGAVNPSGQGNSKH